MSPRCVEGHCGKDVLNFTVLVWFVQKLLDTFDTTRQFAEIRAQSIVSFPIGGHVNVLSDYKETVPEKKIYTVTTVMSLIR